MKKYIFAIFIFIPFTSCFKWSAQRNYNDRTDDRVMLERKISKETINRLKNTTTVFFLNSEDNDKNDSIKKAISSAWTLTPIIFDDVKNAPVYASSPQYSYFIIEAHKRVTRTSHIGTFHNTHYYLVLRIFNDKGEKTGKDNVTGLCRIELYPDFPTIDLMNQGKSSMETLLKIYNEGEFYNWSPIHLQAHLANVESNLKANIRPWVYAEVKSKGLKKLLVNDTLYVSKKQLVSFNVYNGKDNASFDAEKVISKYKYNYRICDEDELYQIFEKEKRGRFLFEYVNSSTDKHVIVLDVKDKKIVHKQYYPASHQLKGKNIRKIN